MQPQDYLPFFQDLALQTYQTTLDLPVYAACLTVLVWLLTAIFYSIRISFIKANLKRALKAGKEIQSALQEAEQRAQSAQEESLQHLASKEQSDQECTKLTERLDDLAQQFTNSINVLAASSDLGQQGLTASPGLAAEALWQRLNAASIQISDKLLEERRALQAMQEAVDAEAAKAVEKDQQIQAMQLRLDSQSQQLAKLSLAQEEHKMELAAQQQASQQQLLELEERYRREMNALSASKAAAAKMEIKTEPANFAASVSAPTPVVKADTAIASAVTVNPTSSNPVQPVSDAVAPAFRAAPMTPVAPATVVPETDVKTPSASIPVAESTVSPVKVEQASAAVTAKATSETKPASNNKLKGFFASAKDTFKKFDQKLGSPADEVVTAEDSDEIVAVEPQQLTEVAEASIVNENVVSTLQIEPMASSVSESASSTPDSTSSAAKKSAKLGGLFNKLKRK